MGKRRKVGTVTIRRADGTVELRRPGYFVKTPYWRSVKWRRLRAQVLQRDGGCCQVCKRKAGDVDPRLKGKQRTVVLEIHHLTYERYGRERLSDLLTLCQRCHATEHAWKRRGVSA